MTPIPSAHAATIAERVHLTKKAPGIPWEHLSDANRAFLTEFVIAGYDAALAAAPTPGAELTEGEVAMLWDGGLAPLGASAPFISKWAGFALRDDDRTILLDFARAAFALGRSRVSPDALTEAKREAASKAWDAGWRNGSLVSGAAEDARDRYLAREYPEARRECVLLANGERVEYDGKVRYRGLTWDSIAGFIQRDIEIGYVLNDAEIQKLYALAATLTPEAR